MNPCENNARYAIARSAGLNPVRLTLFLEHHMLFQDRVVLFDVHAFGCVALVFDRVINIRTLSASEFHMHPLSDFFLAHFLSLSLCVYSMIVSDRDLTERKTQPVG